MDAFGLVVEGEALEVLGRTSFAFEATKDQLDAGEVLVTGSPVASAHERDSPADDLKVSRTEPLAMRVSRRASDLAASFSG